MTVAAIVGKLPIPKMCKVRQIFDDYKIDNIENEIKATLKRKGTLERVKSGDKIAITAGSRGIANIDRIIKTVVDEVKRAGAKPFIVPAMGSHGGATAQGQVEVLASYNITESTMGCPIKASMETVKVGVSQYGKQVHIDKNAYKADGIIVIGRIKPHTCFHGKYESGLVKMITIGLGKQSGAENCHADGFPYMEQNICAIAKVALETTNIIFGIAVVENAYEQTRTIKAVPSEDIFNEEPVLLDEARKNMPSILFDEFDVLVVDEIGKNISGDGMDPNITGTFGLPDLSGGANKQRIVVLDLTEETYGNSMGLGLADFSVQRAFDKLEFEKTYPNALTSTMTPMAKIPMIMANDKLAIQAAILTCNKINYNNPRIVRIKNTLSIGEIYISESLVKEVEENNIKILKECKEMKFDKDNNLLKTY